LRHNLEDEFNAVMSDLSPNLPRFALSTSAMVVTPDQLRAVEEAQKRVRTTMTGSAVAGGLAGGGAAVLALGSALLGPLGLLGGALVGYKLSGLAGGAKSLERAQETIKERLDEIARDLLADFDRQVEAAVEALRSAVVRRRKMFASDLYQQ